MGFDHRQRLRPVGCAQPAAKAQAFERGGGAGKTQCLLDRHGFRQPDGKGAVKHVAGGQRIHRLDAWRGNMAR